MARVIEFRSIDDNDLGFLAKVYASTRQDEVAKTGWTQEQIDEFLSMQFRAQHQFYQEQFSDADFAIVKVDGVDAGRLYLEQREDEVRIVDIALLPMFRGAGLGSQLLNNVISDAFGQNKVVRIHVEKNNPALNLYQRLGFKQIEDKGVYLLMEKTPLQKIANS